MANLKKNRLTKTDVIDQIATQLDMPKTHVTNVVNSMLSIMFKQLAKGGSVNLMGFGSFSVKNLLPRKGRNIHTGEEVSIPARKRVKFSASKDLSEAVDTK